MSRLTCRAAVVGTLLVVACGGSSSGGGEPIVIDGSSTVFPLTEAVTGAFKHSHRNATVQLTFSGTRTGFERFCADRSDIQNASRPITVDEQALCASNKVAFVELPVGLDGITVIVHPHNTWATTMTVDELRSLWRPEAERSVTRWRQIRTEWPDREIHLMGPGTESGTFDYFTDAIVGRVDASRKDYAASGDDEQIVASVAGDELALGYVGFAYFERHRDRVRAVAIDDLKDDVGQGPIEPTLSNIGRGRYRPLSRPLFIYVNTARLARPEVQAFVTFYMRQAGSLAANAATIPLTARAYELGLQRFEKGVTGTMYKAPDSANLGVEYLLNQ